MIVLRKKTSSLHFESFLSHNDFGPKHIMIQNDTVSGILDFGETCGHSPINDFAKWEYWFSNEVPLEWLKDGYTNKELFKNDFDETLHLIQLNNGLGVLWWYYDQKYPEAVEKAKDKILKDFKEIRK